MAMRHCDGTDDNLIRDVPVGEFDPAIMTPSVNWDRIGRPGFRRVRCTCGMAFDDVDRLVTYPHEYV